MPDDLVYSRADMTWLPRAEFERRRADREERAFWRARRRQGELCCPMVIRDGMDAVQSQVDGRLYDSKAAIRAHYRQAGVIEVGNDGPMKSPPKPVANHERNREAAHRAFAAVDTMSDESCRARQWESAEKQRRIMAERDAATA